jgi:peroxiredoxin
MPPIGELDKIPDGTLLYIDDSGALQKVTMHALGEGKKIVIVGVPGAFTPTCR